MAVKNGCTPAIVTAWLEESVSAGRMTAGTAKGYRAGVRYFFEFTASKNQRTLDEAREREALDVIRNSDASALDPNRSISEFILSDIEGAIQAYVDALYVSKTPAKRAQTLLSQLRTFCMWLHTSDFTDYDPARIENPIVKPELVVLPLVRVWLNEWIALERVTKLTAQNYRAGVMRFVRFVSERHSVPIHYVQDRKALERLLSSAASQSEKPATTTEWICGERTAQEIDAFLTRLVRTDTKRDEGTVLVSQLRMLVSWLVEKGLTTMRLEDVKNPFASGHVDTVLPPINAWLDQETGAGRLTRDTAKTYERKLRAVVQAVIVQKACPLDPRMETAVYQSMLAAPKTWERPTGLPMTICEHVCYGLDTLSLALASIAATAEVSQVIMNQIASATRKFSEYLRSQGFPAEGLSDFETPHIGRTEVDKATPVEPPEPSRTSRGSDSSDQPRAKPPRSVAKKKRAKQRTTSRPNSGVSSVTRLRVPRRTVSADAEILEAIEHRNRLITSLIQDGRRTFTQIRDWRYVDLKLHSNALAIRDSDGSWYDWHPAADILPLLHAYHRAVSSCSLVGVWKKNDAPLFLSGDGGELTVDDDLRPSGQEAQLFVCRDTTITALITDGMSFSEVLGLTTGSLPGGSSTPGELYVFSEDGSVRRRHSVGAQAARSLRSYVEVVRVLGFFGAGAEPLFMAADRGTLTADDIA